MFDYHFIRDFPFEIAWNHSRLGMLPIVTTCAPPVSSAWEIFHISSQRPQFLGSFRRNHAPSSSLAGFRARCAQTFPLAATVLASSRSYVSAPIDGRWRQRESFNAVEDRCKQVPRDSHFGKLERHICRVPRHLGPDLDEFLS